MVTDKNCEPIAIQYQHKQNYFIVLIRIVEFEELNGVKCGIVEKNIYPAQWIFKVITKEFNGYEVIVAPSPRTQSSPAKPVAEGETPPPPPPPAPETFTVGVTDYTHSTASTLFWKSTKSKMVIL